MTDTTTQDPPDLETLEHRLHALEAEQGAGERALEAAGEDISRTIQEGKDPTEQQARRRRIREEQEDRREAITVLRSRVEEARARERKERAEKLIAWFHRSIGGLTGQRPNDEAEAERLIGELRPLLARIFGGAARQRWTQRLTGALGELMDLPVPQSRKMLPVPERDGALTALRRSIKSLADSTSTPRRPPGGTAGASPEEQIAEAVSWLREGFGVEDVGEVTALLEDAPPSPAQRAKDEEEREKEEHARKVAADLSGDPVLRGELQRARAEESLGLDPARGGVRP